MVSPLVPAHVNAPLPMLPKALTHHEPILLKLLAKSREDRYATAEEVLAALAARRELILSGGQESPQTARDELGYAPQDDVSVFPLVDGGNPYVDPQAGVLSSDRP